MGFIDDLLEPIPIPRFVRVEQQFPRPALSDIGASLRDALTGTGVLKEIEPGMRVAVTAGSRGITDQARILKTLIAELRTAGADPFIFPAMGSHGGATAEGQRQVLEKFGITESAMGCPILSDMATVEIGVAENGTPVHVDRFAFEADAIVPVNRIKPHVGFRGRYESGLVKMLAIGMGKQRGAEFYHNLGFGRMEENIVAAAEICLARCPIPFGVAVVENPYHETARIEVLPGAEILAGEPPLLEEAKAMLPKIRLNPLDVVVLDEVGKNIAGVGYDSNILGRFHTAFIKAGPGTSEITRIAALDLTDASRGNANGLGNLDFTTRRAFEKIDFEQTYPNGLTSTVPSSVKIPMVLGSDRRAIQAAIRTCNIGDPRDVRIVRIKNTLSLGEIEISENLMDEAKALPDVRILTDPAPLPFDEKGNLF